MDARVKPAHDALLFLPLHRLPADVAAAKAFRPADAIHRHVSAALRLGDGVAGSADVEHASAIGENLAVLRHRAGVEDLDALDLGRLVEALDHRAFIIVTGITLSGHAHRERGLVVPAQAEILQLP